MAQGDTVERILHAATLLFAERGFAETSLRTITGLAEVNLAAVNYHFGSKKELIQAVFYRFLQPYCRELNKQLDILEDASFADGGPSVENLLKCMLETLLVATEEIHENPHIFMRLLGLAYTQSQEHLRRYLVGAFSTTYGRFVGLLRRVSPEVEPVEFYWRLYFVLGAAVFTMSSFDSIRGILNTEYQEDTTLQGALGMMIPSLASIIKAPSENHGDE